MSRLPGIQYKELKALLCVLSGSKGFLTNPIQRIESIHYKPLVVLVISIGIQYKELKVIISALRDMGVDIWRIQYKELKGSNPIPTHKPKSKWIQYKELKAFLTSSFIAAHHYMNPIQRIESPRRPRGSVLHRCTESNTKNWKLLLTLTMRLTLTG